MKRTGLLTVSLLLFLLEKSLGIPTELEDGEERLKKTKHFKDDYSDSYKYDNRGSDYKEDSISGSSTLLLEETPVGQVSASSVVSLDGGGSKHTGAFSFPLRPLHRMLVVDENAKHTGGVDEVNKEFRLGHNDIWHFDEIRDDDKGRLKGPTVMEDSLQRDRLRMATISSSSFIESRLHRDLGSKQTREGIRIFRFPLRPSITNIANPVSYQGHMGELHSAGLMNGYDKVIDHAHNEGNGRHRADADDSSNRITPGLPEPAQSLPLSLTLPVNNHIVHKSPPPSPTFHLSLPDRITPSSPRRTSPPSAPISSSSPANSFPPSAPPTLSLSFIPPSPVPPPHGLFTTLLSSQVPTSASQRHQPISDPFKRNVNSHPGSSVGTISGQTIPVVAVTPRPILFPDGDDDDDSGNDDSLKHDCENGDCENDDHDENGHIFIISDSKTIDNIDQNNNDYTDILDEDHDDDGLEDEDSDDDDANDDSESTNENAHLAVFFVTPATVPSSSLHPTIPAPRKPLEASRSTAPRPTIVVSPGSSVTVGGGGTPVSPVTQPKALYQPPEIEKNYQFNYEVYHEDNHYGHKEKKDGTRVTGQYHVNLPDGRRQVVTYYADETGYHPTITYEKINDIDPRSLPASSSLSGSSPRHTRNSVYPAFGSDNINPLSLKTRPSDHAYRGTHDVQRMSRKVQNIKNSTARQKCTLCEKMRAFKNAHLSILRQERKFHRNVPTTILPNPI